MSKMRALLDQENWSEIDVPDEFQGIVNSLCSSESVVSGDSGGASDDIAVVSSSDGPSESDAGPLNTSQSVERPDSNGTYIDNNSNTDPLRSSVPTENSSADVSTSSNGNNASTKERGKSSLRMLYFKGVAYHMVNW